MELDSIFGICRVNDEIIYESTYFSDSEKYDMEDFDVIISDLRLPGAPGTDLIKASSTPVLIMTSYSSIRSAIDSMKMGAVDYIAKPFEHNEIIESVAKVIREHAKSAPKEKPAADEIELPVHGMIGSCPQMMELFRRIRKVALTSSTVLINGESGTGKELVTRLVHAKSGRKGGKFIAINCAAIPENLLESELFGHEKGAFTGAVARRLGKFEEASGGTLLLDEISEMDPHLQAKLLRAIQEKEIDRVGGSKPIPVDVRIVATSNRNIEDEVAKGNFREDLYYRLNVINLKIPALSERPGDIPVLAEHFVAKYAEANGMPALPITKEVLKMLAGYTWPGNVRELENTMHRAVLLSTGDKIESKTIILGGIEAGSNGTQPAGDGEDASTAGLVGRTVADVERELIIETLHHCLGNRTHAATILGISIRTLRNKLKQYGESGFTVPTPGEAERPTA